MLPHRPSQLIVLAPPAEGAARGADAVSLDAAPRAGGHRSRRALGPPGRRCGPGRSGRGAARAAARAAPARHRRAPPAPRPPVGIGRIGPGLAEGRLWVRPLPLPPEELAQRLQEPHRAGGQRGHRDRAGVSRLDRERSRGADARRCRAGPPTIAGKKFGLDSKNIYIAGLKIPAAVLALLPIPAGNVDQNRAYNHLMDLRADLQYAAQRAENLEEFKDDDPRHAAAEGARAGVRAEPADAPPPADTAPPYVRRTDR